VAEDLLKISPAAVSLLLAGEELLLEVDDFIVFFYAVLVLMICLRIYVGYAEVVPTLGDGLQLRVSAAVELHLGLPSRQVGR